LTKLSLLGKHWTSAGLKSFEELRNSRNLEECDFHPAGGLKDLEKTVERIREAITGGERILVVGDYDADGICASVILYKTIASLGGEVSVRLPHREKHGYGLNREFIEEAKELGVKLIITVDNGITAFAEIDLANNLGIDVIITDHHLPVMEKHNKGMCLPNAFAIVNPRREDCSYPQKNLCGATIAYKLATILLEQESSELANELENKKQDLLDEFLALSAIATIADVCELKGENRKIVQEGLKLLPKIKNLGLQKILANAGVKETVSSEDVGFRISPRINASGRIDSPLCAFQALANVKGEQYADKLEKLNVARQSLTRENFTEIEMHLGEIGEQKILLASGANLHLGIIGLIAGRLAEKWNRPAIIMSEVGENFVGSCRSPLEKFNITEALQKLSDLLEKFGGHKAAAGFTLPQKNREEFERRLQEFGNARIKDEEIVPALKFDFEVNEEDLSFDLLKKIETLQPFGMGNPPPLLLWKNVNLGEIRKVGADERHLRMKVGKQNFVAIAFGLGELANKLEKDKQADLVFELSENVWNGRRDLQLRVVDLKLN